MKPEPYDFPDYAAKLKHLQEMRKPRDRGAFLGKVCDRLNLCIRNVAEIGVYRGGFSVNLRAQFPRAHLYLVDPWAHIPELSALGGSMHRAGATPEGNQRAWDVVFAEVERKFKDDTNVTFHRCVSREGAQLIADNSLDLAYIDADHRYEFVVEDIKLWLPKVKRGCVLAGHDYRRVRVRKKLYEAFQAVNDTLGQQNIIVGRQMTWAYVVP